MMNIEIRNGHVIDPANNINSVTSLFICESGTQRPVGVVHLHDLLKAGIA